MPGLFFKNYSGDEDSESWKSFFFEVIFSLQKYEPMKLLKNSYRKSFTCMCEKFHLRIRVFVREHKIIT